MFKITIVVHKQNGYLGGEGPDNKDHIDQIIINLPALSEPYARVRAEEERSRIADETDLPTQVWDITSIGA